MYIHLGFFMSRCTMLKMYWKIRKLWKNMPLQKRITLAYRMGVGVSLKITMNRDRFMRILALENHFKKILSLLRLTLPCQA